MSLDDRFDELAGDLAGLYRAWNAYLGIELGLFESLRTAGEAGLTAAELAETTGCRPEPVHAWARFANAAGLVSIESDRIRLDEDVAVILLDDQRSEYLGGQFVSTVVASLDFGALPDYFRSGRTIERPNRYREAIERLTAQDIAVFFEEVLGGMPNLVADLSRGGAVVDLHCGGGRWLVAMAERFPTARFVGIEFEPDSVERARATIAAAGLADRITIEAGQVVGMGHAGEFVLAYFQYALHQLDDPVGGLVAAWTSLRPGGRLIILDWCLPESVEDDRTLLGELLWGVQLDEQLGGTGLLTHEELIDLFDRAGLPEPTTFDTPSGVSVFRVRKPE